MVVKWINWLTALKTELLILNLLDLFTIDDNSLSLDSSSHLTCRGFVWFYATRSLRGHCLRFRSTVGIGDMQLILLLGECNKKVESKFVNQLTISNLAAYSSSLVLISFFGSQTIGRRHIFDPYLDDTAAFSR